jgi:hypothetical protein
VFRSSFCCFIEEPLAHHDGEGYKVEDYTDIKSSQELVEVLHEMEIPWSVSTGLIECRSIFRSSLFVSKFLDKVLLR